MKIAEVAEMLDTTPLTIRIGLQQGVFPFGVAFKRRADSKNYTYIIYPEKLREYCGVKEDEKEKN